MAPVPVQILQQAITAHRDGRLSEAERLYRAILAEHPKEPDVNHNLGILSVATGRVRESLEFFESAVQGDANQQKFWLSYIDALVGIGRLDQALEALRQVRSLGLRDQAFDLLERNTIQKLSDSLVAKLVVAFKSGDSESFELVATELVERCPSSHIGWKALGLANLRKRNPKVALGKLLKAKERNSSDAETMRYIAEAQRDLGLLEDAEASYRSAIHMKPDFAEAHHDLGTLLALSHRFTEAEALYRRSIALRPSFVSALTSLGVTLQNLNRHDEAKYYFRRATILSPTDSRVHYNLGRFLQVQDDLEEAESAYRMAIEHDPDNFQALLNLGETLKDLGKVNEALEFCDRAVTKNPGHARAHWNRSLQNLRLGNFVKGWEEYEWRWKYDEFPTRKLDMDKPLWLGREHLDGKRILIHSEQGFGDTIQFCRYAKLLLDVGASVLFAPQRPLIRLMKGMIENCEVVDVNDKTLYFDYHAPLLSLPLAFGTDLTSIPSVVPYLRADPDRVCRWRRRIGDRGFKIGICWQGNVGHLDRGRSFPVACLSGISRVPGVRLLCLLKGASLSQLQELPGEMNIEIFGEEFDQGPDAFLDTAAVMKACDLVITSDTAIAHLGGALGVPTWVALKSVPDWRWMLERSDSPWYPSMRLFRQKSRGEWSTVFSSMEDVLTTTVNAE